MCFQQGSRENIFYVSLGTCIVPKKVPDRSDSTTGLRDGSCGTARSRRDPNARAFGVSIILYYEVHVARCIMYDMYTQPARARHCYNNIILSCVVLQQPHPPPFSSSGNSTRTNTTRAHPKWTISSPTMVQRRQRLHKSKSIRMI